MKFFKKALLLLFCISLNLAAIFCQRTCGGRTESLKLKMKDLKLEERGSQRQGTVYIPVAVHFKWGCNFS